jgi:hypothetical protein
LLHLQFCAHTQTMPTPHSPSTSRLNHRSGTYCSYVHIVQNCRLNNIRPWLTNLKGKKLVAQCIDGFHCFSNEHTNGRRAVLGKMWCLSPRCWNLHVCERGKMWWGAGTWFQYGGTPQSSSSSARRFQYLRRRHHIFPSTSYLPYNPLLW